MKDQKITRIKLKELYNHFKSCNKWKDIIGSTLIEETGTTINVSGSKLQEAYNEANPTQKKLIGRYFKIELPIDITKKVKNFDDILKLSGKKLEDIIPWKNAKTKEKKSQNAFAKIQLITEVYNQGTVLDWNNSNEYKYYPYFTRRARGGWVFDVSHCGYSAAYRGFGCYFKARELSDDAGKKFIDIFNDYLPL